MDMFSKELQILDENTVQYMMDEMQDAINAMRGTIDEQAKFLKEKDNMIRRLQERLQEVEKQDS